MNGIYFKKGSVTTTNEFPWQAFLVIYKSTGSFYCGATLISNQWVLTAAHCLDKFNKILFLLTCLFFSASQYR